MDIVEAIAGIRMQISDDDPAKNILNGKQLNYTDAQITFFINRSLKDINKMAPITNFTLATFPTDQEELITAGAIIFICMKEGFLQLKNQIDFNDAGLALGLFNKSGAYQGWASFLLQMYISDKLEFKRTILPRSAGGGFFGIGTQFSDAYGNYNY